MDLESHKEVLILGGSKFMGRATVNAFVAHGWQVTTYNRGHVHWEPCMPPSVHRAIGDREEETNFHNFLLSRTWSIVVDFTSYDSGDMPTIIECLQGRVEHYIFISSDSVYQVCPLNSNLPFEQAMQPKKVTFWENIHYPTPDGIWIPRTEISAIPVKSPKLKQKLKKKDSYGYGKLRCEEKLLKAYQKSTFPFTALRLPDVIGPFDHTKRHWKYQLWVRSLMNSENTEFSESIEVDCYGDKRPLSFVYCEDVVQSIFLIIEKKEITFGESFNISFNEKITLCEYISRIGKILGKNEKINFEIREGKSKKDFFPSVNFGPVTNEKAKEILGFKPTSLDDALNETCDWFDDAWIKFPSKRPLVHLTKEQQKYLYNYYQTKN